MQDNLKKLEVQRMGSKNAVSHWTKKWLGEGERLQEARNTEREAEDALKARLSFLA
jgi:hypothetical protein